MSAPKRGAQGVTIDQGIAAVVEAKQAANCRPVSVKALRQYLTQFARGRESWPLASFTVEVVEDWFQRRKEARSTQQSNTGRLSSLFAFAERRGWIDRNPCRQLERVRMEHKPPFILSPDQAALVMDYARQRKPGQLAFWTLAMLAGVRPDELRHVTWEAVNLDDDIVTIDAAASKVRRRRIITLEPSALLWLKYAREHGARLPVKRMTRRRYLDQARRLLGFEKWPHDCLRHTAASFLLALHKDAGKVAYSLGNSARILETHYKQLVTAKQCLEFWSFTPASARPENPKPVTPAPVLNRTIDPALPLFARVEAALQIEPTIRALAKQRQREGSYFGGVNRRRMDGERFDSLRELGKLAGCTRQTVKLCKRIVRLADPGSLDSLRQGRVSVARAYRGLTPVR